MPLRNTQFGRMPLWGECDRMPLKTKLSYKRGKEGVDIITYGIIL